MPFPHASQALSRFTVLDLTRVRSGPTCVRQLADWGANVIKIDALTEEAGGPQPFLNEPNIPASSKALT
jgi:crotonobetainyl-CoA:carnitine CoA-transferase CaiB-like acyl-CoA transferase